MKFEDVEVGMKVVPFQKTKVLCDTFSTSLVINQMEKYAVVKSRNYAENCWILGSDTNPYSGDYFNACDFEPYKERGMKDEDVKIGMKVVPYAKTSSIYAGLENSANWENAKEINQPFLYVADFDENRNNWILNYKSDTKNGDYFNACDFEPYVEDINVYINFETHHEKQKSRQVTSDYIPRSSVIVRETYNGAFALEIIRDGKEYAYGTLDKVLEKLKELFA
jgi:hypothetical protein